MLAEFADLARKRELLKNFCKLHESSVLRFKFDGNVSFKINLEEPERRGNLHHLTSTSTCIESLMDCPGEFCEEKRFVKGELAREFAKLAIKREPAKWISEGSAEIYCKCRALPFVIRHLDQFDARLAQHIDVILFQLKKRDRFAIGEASPSAVNDQNWYPPNAFHTYWFLCILEELEKRFTPEFKKLNRNDFLYCRRDQMLLWAKAAAGRQVSLHTSDSSTLDSDQLAWSLAILTRFGTDFQSNLADQDFLRQGFEALFAKQTPAGTWHHGRPLFHYKEAGNAYCYVYETFTVLLKNVLERKNEGEFLRATLEPFLPKLIRLWEYALTTQIPLTATGESRPEVKAIGWSSGHRMEQIHAESWATASVFSYVQALRRLVGEWTRQKALLSLNQVRTFISSANAQKNIVDRGTTWQLPDAKAEGVAEELTTLFVNPVRMSGSHESMEPDAQPIGVHQARSAILFGPPGTSKTSLVRAVAGAIGWRYVELHASHFVSEGLPAVQHTADNIFERLMELDHTVILFDEIDELVRERDVEPDAFGRFLTTSMLPKLAELWEQRKVIYFIATNHIEYFDRAVTRAQRFDALIFVPPPAFEKKMDELERLIRSERPGIHVRRTVRLGDVNASLDMLECASNYSADAYLGPSELLAKFVLLRWDQLVELAVLIVRAIPPGTTHLNLTAEILTKGLEQIADPSLRIKKTYCDFKRAVKYSMRDFGKDTVWQVENLIANGSYSPPLEIKNGAVWLSCRRPDKIIIDSYEFSSTPGGRVKALDRKSGLPKSKKRR